MSLYLGCPVWSFKGWVGNFYPKGTQSKDFLREYARRNGHGYIDYHRELRGEGGELNPALGNDGVHPNQDGYAVMRRAAEAALAGVLR